MRWRVSGWGTTSRGAKQVQTGRTCGHFVVPKSRPFCAHPACKAAQAAHLLQRRLSVVVWLLETGQHCRQLRVAERPVGAAAGGTKPVFCQDKAPIHSAARAAVGAGGGEAVGAAAAGRDAQAAARGAQRRTAGGGACACASTHCRAGRRRARPFSGGQRVAHKQAAGVLPGHKHVGGAVWRGAAAAAVAAAAGRPRRLLRRRQEVCGGAAHAGGAHAAPRPHAHAGAWGDGPGGDEGGGARRATAQQAGRALREADLVFGGGGHLEGRRGSRDRGLSKPQQQQAAASQPAATAAASSSDMHVLDELHDAGTAQKATFSTCPGRLWQHAIGAGGHARRLHLLRLHQRARRRRPRRRLRRGEAEGRSRLAGAKQATANAKGCIDGWGTRQAGESG